MKAKFRLFIIGSLITISFVGCGEKKIETHEVPDTQASALTDDLTESLQITEDVWKDEISIEGSQYTVKVHAEVMVPDVNYMHKIAYKQKVFSAQDKERIISELAEGDVYDGAMLIANSDETADVESTWEKIDNYEGEHYIFSYLGQDYVLTMANDTALEQYGGTYMRFEPVSNVYNYGKQYSYGNFTNTPSKNQCEISKDEACQAAVEFVKKMEQEEFCVVSSYPLQWYETEKNHEESYVEWLDGYEVVLYRQVDGVLVDGCMPADFLVSDIEGPYARNRMESVHVFVTDSGVVGYEHNGARAVGEVVESKVSLKPYSTILDEMKTQVVQTDFYGDYSPYRGKLELLYFPVYPEQNTDTCVLCPYWKLTDDDDDQLSNFSKIVDACDVK